VAYEHNDVDDLRRKIAETTEYGRRLIVSDGVFSMDGDIAPLPDIYEVAQEHDILLMVDDAHGEGVLGAAGAASSITLGCTARSISRSAR
jgi:glycine C-acetyltransferase